MCAEFVQAESSCLCQVVRVCFCIKGYVLKKRCCRMYEFFSSRIYLKKEVLQKLLDLSRKL